jgi:hypothetical protein
MQLLLFVNISRRDRRARTWLVLVGRDALLSHPSSSSFFLSSSSSSVVVVSGKKFPYTFHGVGAIVAANGKSEKSAKRSSDMVIGRPRQTIQY